MRSDPATTLTRRNANLATTASALIAIVAIAALVSGPVVRATPLETRATSSETTSVRAIAAAVAAVARELVGKDRIVLDVPACHPLAGLMMALPVALIVQVDDQPILPLRTIGERLLDLPPPVC